MSHSPRSHAAGADVLFATGHLRGSPTRSSSHGTAGASSERPGQPRPKGRRLPPFGHRDQAFALRLFPGSFARAPDGFCLLAGFALGRFFVRLATLHLTKTPSPCIFFLSALSACSTLLSRTNTCKMFPIVAAHRQVSDSIKPSSNIGALRGSRKGSKSAMSIAGKGRTPWTIPRTRRSISHHRPEYATIQAPVAERPVALPPAIIGA